MGLIFCYYGIFQSNIISTSIHLIISQLFIFYNYFLLMKVELAKDPLYERKQSPLKQLKQKSRQHRKQKKLRKLSLQNRIKEVDIQVVDPLPLQFELYKQDLTYNKLNEKSKACQNLKRYIISQQRNLKHVRLDRINFMDEKNESLNTSKFSNTHDIKLKFDVTKEDQKLKEINIPKIEQLFKNQIKDNLIFENRQLYRQLDARIGAIQDSLRSIKTFNNEEKTKSSIIKKHIVAPPPPVVQDQIDLDQIIENNLQKSKNFRLKLETQKKLINKLQNNKQGPQKFAQLLNKFQQKKKKKQEWLQINPKPMNIKEGDKQYKFTPPSMLLHQLHRLSDQKQKKQSELTNLLKNCYQNRNDVMIDKSLFYDQQVPFNDLSPSNQFRLRVMMDKKLSHRLQLSKQQVHKFIEYLSEIKGYHVVISSSMIQILMKIRQNLLSGKVMKHHDLDEIIQKYDASVLEEGKNSLIISKLKSMMI